MNAGVNLQTLAGSNTTAKTVNTQLVNSNNGASNSFKKEMDKAFDRNQSTTKDASKGSLTDKVTSNKALQKTDSKEYPEKNADFARDDQNTDITKEQQVLAAAQIQQPNVVAMNADITACDALQQMQGEVVTNALLGAVVEKPEINLTEIFGNAEKTGEGEIKLPFQNNVDLVKSAMLKSVQGEGQENQMQNFAETLTNGGQIKGEKVQESGATQIESANLQNLKSEGDDPKLEQVDMPEENVLAKTNNLDLSKVNIKVAEAPIDTNQADMAKQLADKIMYKLSDGKQEFDLELNPKNLGKVNVKMIFQNGSAELILSTSNSKAHQLLSMQADALRGILESNTGMDSTISLKQAETSDGQFDRDNFQEQSKGQQQQQQQQEKKMAGDISFIDRLRLGLVDNLEEAV
ncbi:MAG: flagellar hook-length control protein FliK [Aminipila sp.]